MAQTETRPGITGVRTVGIPVRDQDRALEFYVDKLGFEKRLDAPFGAGGRWIEVAPPGAPTSIALVSSAASGTDTGIRLTTKDARADHAALKGRGVDVDAEIQPYPVPMFAFRDQDGNRLILVQEA
jgi:catechol 2,3-dioxygenase-like lactoylglutathione lyase family enzyme